MRFGYLSLVALMLAAASFPHPPATADQATSAPLQLAQAGSEFDFWNAIKNSTKAEDYRAYLEKYPNGNFAELAKLRMKKYAAAPAAKPAPAPLDPQQADIAYWNSIKTSKNADDYKAYLRKYPNGELAELAKLRIDQLTEPVAPPVSAPPEATPTTAPPPPPAPEPATTQLAVPEAAKPKPAALEQITPRSTVRSSARPQPMTFAARDDTVYAKNGGQVRAQPNPKAALVAKLETDTEVHATGLSADGRWWRVEVEDGQVGYMHHSVVSDPSEEAPPLPETDTTEPPLYATLPATTQPATTQPIFPTTTLPASNRQATTQPTMQLPATTQPTLPGTTQAASIGRPATPIPVAPNGTAGAANEDAPDEGVCPATAQVEPEARIAACERLVAKAQDGPKVAALGDLAAALAQAGRYDESINAYKQAAALAPRNAVIYYDIGLVRLDQLRFQEARAAFDKAAQLAPQNPDIVFQRGIAYIGLGDFDTARLEVKSALVSKDDAAYYEKLGEIEIARGDADAARVALQRGRKADPSRRSLTLAVVNYYAGDIDTAAVQVDSNKDDPIAGLWYALFKKAKGDPNGAALALETGRAAYGNTWPGPIFDALSGALSLDQARAAAQAGEESLAAQQLCALNFFAGEWAYLSGDMDAARMALNAALATRAYHTLAFAAASARLSNMGG